MPHPTTDGTPDTTTDDGCRLWTRVTGDGPPVVLVHGGPGWWDVFQDLPPLLPNFTVHRWDQRGCGRSDRRGPYTLDRFVADLDQIRESAGQEQVVLLGHSWGAALALQYEALPHAERVVLDGVAHYPWVEDPDGFQKAVGSFLS
jgi:proline iminopeptidase